MSLAILIIQIKYIEMILFDSVPKAAGIPCTKQRRLESCIFM